MGRHTTNATTALHEPVAVTITGDAVAVGDYVRVEASGIGRRAVDGLPLAVQNTGAGVTALTGLDATAHVPSANYGGGVQSSRQLAVLGNGNVACLYAGNGTTATTALSCRIYNPLKIQVAAIAVTAAAGLYAYRVIKLNAANFAVVWGDGSDLKLAIYTNAGAVVLAASTVATIAGATTISKWAAAALANGDLVLAYDKPASTGVFFARYNASGVLQGAETTIEATVAGDYMCVLPLAAGGWWIYYRNSTASIYKVARYNALGALQGALITVFAGGANLTAGMYEHYAVELSNGNVALIDPTTDTTSAVRLYDSAGTFLTTPTNNIGLATGAPNRTTIRAKAGGGFYVSALGGLLVHYDNTGNRLFSVASANQGGTSNSGMLIDRVGTGPILIHAYDSSGTGAITARAWDSSLAPEASTLTVQATTTGVLSLWAELMPCGLLAYTFYLSTLTGGVVHGRLAPQAASVLGLATTAGTDGQQVTVATAGRWRANQAFGPTSFDRRSSVPVGCKAVVTGGTQAVLLGIVA